MTVFVGIADAIASYRYVSHIESTYYFVVYRMEERPFSERFEKLASATRSFDIEFWQAQGSEAIFEAAMDMIRDYYLLRGEDADEFRIQRTVEHFFRS